MTEYRDRRESYVSAHRSTRNGNRAALIRHEDALAYLLDPSPLDPDTEASLRARIAELESRPPEIREVEKIVERVVEAPPLSPEPAKFMIPDEIRKLMEDGESLSSAKRRLTELLWVEQAELRNLRGTDRENLKREAEIERLLGLFARLGEI